MRVCFVFSKTVYTREVTPDGLHYVEEDLHLGTPFTKTLEDRTPYVQPPAVARVKKAALDRAPKIAAEYRISYRLHRELEQKRQGQEIARALGLTTTSATSSHSADSVATNGNTEHDPPHAPQVADGSEPLRPPKRRKCFDEEVVSQDTEHSTAKYVLVLPSCDHYGAAFDVQ